MDQSVFKVDVKDRLGRLGKNGTHGGAGVLGPRDGAGLGVRPAEGGLLAPLAVAVVGSLCGVGSGFGGPAPAPDPDPDGGLAPATGGGLGRSQLRCGYPFGRPSLASLADSVILRMCSSPGGTGVGPSRVVPALLLHLAHLVLRSDLVRPLPPPPPHQPYFSKRIQRSREKKGRT